MAKSGSLLDPGISAIIALSTVTGQKGEPGKKGTQMVTTLSLN